MELNFSSFSDSNITMKISEGVYYFEDKPIYIVEHIQEQGSEYVLVYAVQPNSDKDNPRRKFDTIREPITIAGGTVLSNIIKSRIPERHRIKQVDSEPLFMANLVSFHKDTVTGHEGKGFFERTPDKVIMKNSGRTVQHGTYTGVYITLQNIKWLRSYTPLDSVVDYYRQQKEERDNVR